MDCSIYDVCNAVSLCNQACIVLCCNRIQSCIYLDVGNCHVSICLYLRWISWRRIGHLSTNWLDELYMPVHLMCFTYDVRIVGWIKSASFGLVIYCDLCSMCHCSKPTQQITTYNYYHSIIIRHCSNSRPFNSYFTYTLHINYQYSHYEQLKGQIKDQTTRLWPKHLRQTLLEPTAR